MRFPQSEQLRLPCQFEQFVPGKLHPDGRRYLPLVILRLPEGGPWSGSGVRLGVVDRHHRVDPMLVGRDGIAQIVFLLGSVRAQRPPHRQGIEPEAGILDGLASTRPAIFGQVVAVPTWQAEHTHLPYESLSTELLLDIGAGVVGVRTNTTAPSLAEHIGTNQVSPGDWLKVSQSRVDILAFSDVL
jgi:hypothetical protein